MARSVALRAQNPSGSSERLTLGTIVSQKARSVSRCARVKPAASIVSLSLGSSSAQPTGSPSELLQCEDRDVVVRLATRELDERRVDSLDGVVGGRGPCQRGLEPLLAEPALAAARIEDAVGVEDEHVARFDVQRRGQPVPLLEAAQQRAGPPDGARLPGADPVR